MNIAKMLQQAQKAQAELQRQLGELEVEGSAGGGLVRITLNGLKELRRVSIDAEALKGEEASLIEDLIVAAWQDATRVVDERSQEILRKVGLPSGMPGLF